MLLSKPTLFSCIDLRCGYHQIRLNRKSRGVTSFTAPNGLRYQYCVCPFGLNTSPAAMLAVMLLHCHRLMLLRLILWYRHYAHSSLVFLIVFYLYVVRFHNTGKYIKSLFSEHHGISAYMDDLACASATFQQHLEHLKTTFQTLRENNLSANPSKCTFGDDGMDYLGHRISADGIHISRKKLQIVRAIPPPKSVKALQRLLGMCNFWRRHICGYAKNTYHMRQLLSVPLL